MKKEFIKDNNEIRRCEANIAKMNIFEYMYCYLFQWNSLRLLFWDYVIVNLWEAIKNLGFVMFNLIQFIFTPVCLPIISYLDIKRSKEYVAKCNEKRNKLNKNKTDIKNSLD